MIPTGISVGNCLSLVLSLRAGQELSSLLLLPGPFHLGTRDSAEFLPNTS